MIQIIEIKDFTPDFMEPVQRLLNQLTTRPVALTEKALKELIAQENTHLFFLLKNKEIAGMITVGIYYSPTGGKAWIEDVVIDMSYRGQGLSKLLVTHAIDFVKARNIPTLMLTSNPSRTTANKLYRSLGFEQKQTNVYRMKNE